jgi:hypothetical protein
MKIQEILNAYWGKKKYSKDTRIYSNKTVEHIKVFYNNDNNYKTGYFYEI